MKALSVSVQVPMATPKGSDTLRVAGFLDDGETIAVATMPTCAERGTQELAFSLGQALELAEACLAGNPRALTTPGLARILSATVAILFRVSVAGGSIVKVEGDANADGHHPHRAAAPADEHSRQ